MSEVLAVPTYVVGFNFSRDRQRVLLIQKTKPAWQKGLLNGVGGKVENNETALEAMVREFKEETNVTTKPEEWRGFASLEALRTGRDSQPKASALVYFFRRFGAVVGVQQMTEEPLRVCWLDLFEGLPVVPNLRWLVPMALSLDLGEMAAYFKVKEFGQTVDVAALPAQQREEKQLDT